MSALLRCLMYFLGRSRHDADLRDEIESHRAHRQDALAREGLDPDAAALASQRAMGNVTLAVEDARDVFHRVSVLVVAGLAIGLAASLWAAQFLGPLLFHVAARDPANVRGRGRCAGGCGSAGGVVAGAPCRTA